MTKQKARKSERRIPLFRGLKKKRPRQGKLAEGEEPSGGRPAEKKEPRKDSSFSPTETREFERRGKKRLSQVAQRAWKVLIRQAGHGL